MLLSVVCSSYMQCQFLFTKETFIWGHVVTQLDWLPPLCFCRHPILIVRKLLWTKNLQMTTGDQEEAVRSRSKTFAQRGPGLNLCKAIAWDVNSSLRVVPRAPFQPTHAAGATSCPWISLLSQSSGSPPTSHPTRMSETPTSTISETGQIRKQVSLLC